LRRIFKLWPLVLLLTASSCDDAPEFLAPQPDAKPAAETPPSRFNPQTAGRIIGRVTWIGEKPTYPPMLFGTPKPDGSVDVKLIANPNLPVIDEKSRGLAGVVVFLRGIDPAAAKPWDLSPASVEMKDLDIRIRQGTAASRAGFVRRGERVEMCSREPAFHILRARGAAWFSLTFPEPDQPLSRSFVSLGRVEFWSGAGYYWANAHLFVVDHPYYALTDGEGRFALEQAPPGPVEVVAWMPAWEVVKLERDPETGLVYRQTYAPPLERSRSVTLTPSSTVTTDFTLP
jgi:hypothetical protein